jgi:hypothetical protein
MPRTPPSRPPLRFACSTLAAASVAALLVLSATASIAAETQVAAADPKTEDKLPAVEVVGRRQSGD